MPSASNGPHFFVSVKADGTFDGELRQSVRSWVTKVQHSRHRERCLNEGRRIAKEEVKEEPCTPRPRAKLSNSSDSEEARSPGGRQRPSVISTTAEKWTFMSVYPAEEATVASRQQVRAHVTRRQHQRRRGAKLKLSRIGTECSSTTESTRPSSPFEHQREATPSPSPSLKEPADMIHAYAESLHTDAATLWSFYLFQERQHGRMFQLQCGEYIDWTPGCLHPLILSDQAMLATTALFTGCYMRYMRSEPTIMSPALFRIRALAYSFVQAAIDRELTDATMLAVVKLALFESVFGNRNAYQVHMQGIAQMLRLRKELSTMDMGGFTAHLLVWFDASLSRIAKAPRYLNDNFLSTSMNDIVEVEKESFMLGMKGERLEVMKSL